MPRRSKLAEPIEVQVHRPRVAVREACVCTARASSIAASGQRWRLVRGAAGLRRWRPARPGRTSGQDVPCGRAGAAEGVGQSLRWAYRWPETKKDRSASIASARPVWRDVVGWERGSVLPP